VRTSNPTPRFAFARCLVPISARILSEDFCGIPQSLQAYFGTTMLPSKLFWRHRSSSILLVDTLCGLDIHSVVEWTNRKVEHGGNVCFGAILKVRVHQKWKMTGAFSRAGALQSASSGMREMRYRKEWAIWASDVRSLISVPHRELNPDRSGSYTPP
jgi:hypothetical protein